MQVKEYVLGEQFLRFYIDDEKRTTMYMVPVSKKDEIINAWEVENDEWGTTFPYIRQWKIGRLVHFHLSHHGVPATCCTKTKKFTNLSDVFFEDQEVIKEGDITIIKTTLKSVEGHKLVNYLKHKEGYNALWSWNEFTNMTDKEVKLDFIASFGFEDLSPFSNTDSRERMILHRFRGGWSKEGRPCEDTFESLALEKAWQGYCKDTSERFGSLGSYSAEAFYPLAVVEDREANVFWTAQLYQNYSWQCDVTRYSDEISFTGGLADGDFGHWAKNIKSGETFTTPVAAISATDKNVQHACQSVVKLQEEARLAYGEEGFPITFNEFCTTWGEPTQENFLSNAKRAAELGAKYVVIDAGWSVGVVGPFGQGGNGSWEINKEIFPDMKAMNKELRDMGLIPGVWFEFEATTKGAKEFESDYDDMHLKRDGYVIKCGDRSFWDMKNPKVIEHLNDRVIKMLKDNGFGYVKVDYNANLGVGCDGCESLGEGLKQNAEAVQEFFKKMKKDIPDLIIENCASGGNRNDPSMLALSAVCSFSDAHESTEIPIVAANLHNHILPAQLSIWAVLRETDTDDRLNFSLCATLFGRVCFSGNIDKLSQKQEDKVKEFVEFYKKTENILKDGTTQTYRYMNKSMRYPKGTQVSVRNTDDEMLIVCHSFEEPHKDAITVEIPEGFAISDEYANDVISIDGTKVTVAPMREFTASAVYAKKNK